MTEILQRLGGTGLIETHLVQAPMTLQDKRRKLIHHGHLLLQKAIFEIFLGMGRDLPFEEVTRLAQELEQSIGQLLFEHCPRLRFEANEENAKLLVGLFHE
jgi:hypothetical protein